MSGGTSAKNTSSQDKKSSITCSDQQSTGGTSKGKQKPNESAKAGEAGTSHAKKRPLDAPGPSATKVRQF